MPSFFDNHVYYICQYYIEMNFVFQSNFNSFQTHINKQYTYYERFLNFQNKTFKIKFNFTFTAASDSNYSIDESVTFSYSDMIYPVAFNIFNVIDLNTFEINRPILISMYNYPLSNFVKKN